MVKRIKPIRNDIGVSLQNKLQSQVQKTEQYNRLKNLIWGLGIEHEVQFFHDPIYKKNKLIKDFTLFDTEPVVKRLYKSNIISDIDKDFLSKIPFEKTGRKCSSKVVIKQTPVLMPEFITETPFSSLTPGYRKFDKNINQGIDVALKRPIDVYVSEIMDKEQKFLNLINKDGLAREQIKKYGKLEQYQFGMTSYLKYAKSYNNKLYKFEKKNGEDVVHQDYLGSYHITMTLPFDENTSINKFIEMHSNFANQIQWLEPLLVTAFFSCDQKSVGTSEKRIKGSWRVTRIGWGNFAGSDVRKFSKGVGRMGNILTYWRDDFDFHGAKLTKICAPVTKEMQEKEPGAITTYSSNFRTFGSTDPTRPLHRESGIGMTKPNGIEIRIFDHFNSEHLMYLSRLMIFIAENSRVTKSTEYVYNNKIWIETTKKIMLEGWSTEISEDYIKLLRKQLGLPIKTKKRVAFYVLEKIVKDLYKKNKNGDWTYLLLKNAKSKKFDILPNINEKSFSMAFALKINRDEKLLSNFKKLLKELKGKYTFDAFKTLFTKYFNEKYWNDDIYKIIHIIGDLSSVPSIHKNFKAVVYHNKDESIDELVIIKNNIKLENLNDLINYYSYPTIPYLMKYIKNIKNI